MPHHIWLIISNDMSHHIWLIFISLHISIYISYLYNIQAYSSQLSLHRLLHWSQISVPRLLHLHCLFQLISVLTNKIFRSFNSWTYHYPIYIFLGVTHLPYSISIRVLLYLKYLIKILCPPTLLQIISQKSQ